MKKRVVVGMSGGVDSSVAAYLLREEGYEVIGITMQIWQPEEESVQEENGGCCGLSAVEDARTVAEHLSIPYYVMNFREEFKTSVMDYFTREYLCGRTPNPCIACNRYVKWEALLKRAMQIGADYIATGHYARVEQLENGRVSLIKSVTEAKDQTYALYNLTQEQLKRTLMPVGRYSKEQIRQIAEEQELPVANKPDSQEICFIPDHDYAKFLQEYSQTRAVPGKFINTAGEVIGTHKGIIHYTVGQRKGLGAFGHPVFVKEVRPETNEVVLSSNEELFSDTLYANQLNFMALPDWEDGMEITAKIRYTHRGAAARVYRTKEDEIKVEFSEPQRAITPGQAVVLYQGELVLGGGTII